MRLENWNSPSATTTGTKFRRVSRTPAVSGSSDTRSGRTSRTTCGSWARIWSALPASVAQASHHASSARVGATRPHPSRSVICAIDQSAALAYELKNSRCEFWTPRHHPEMTIRPVIGKSTRTSRVVSS